MLFFGVCFFSYILLNCLLVKVFDGSCTISSVNRPIIISILPDWLDWCSCEHRKEHGSFDVCYL